MLAIKRKKRINHGDRLAILARKRNSEITREVDLVTTVPGDVGPRLADLCSVLGWKNPKLAEEGGVSLSQASRWLNGHQAPTLKALNRIIHRNKLPKMIFVEGGPMPSTVNPPLTGRSSLGGGLASEEEGQHTGTVNEAAGPGYGVEGPGWQFGDPSSWDEEQLLTVLNNQERTFRATLTTLDEKGILRLRVVALEQMIDAARERGRPLKDFAYRILRELQAGER